MYRILFLIPYHENKESLKDSIDNLFKFNKKIFVIINNGSGEDISDINSDHVMVVDRLCEYKRFDTMIPLHIELWDKIKENNIVSHYVCLFSTNQLFIKHNLYELMKKYDASFFERDIDQGCIPLLRNNQLFRKYHDELNEYFKYQSNPDGMFFKYSIFYDMMDYFNDFRETQIEYHADEFLYVSYVMSKNYSLLNYNEYNYWIPDWRYNYGHMTLDQIKPLILQDKYYLIKRVNRNINDEVRQYVRNV